MDRLVLVRGICVFVVFYSVNKKDEKVCDIIVVVNKWVVYYIGGFIDDR